MNRILFSLIFCTFALSETILIPEDYATIQEGIDASEDGDTVKVADGDYVENLILNKSIVLASYAIEDDLDDWIRFDADTLSQWVINNPHIANTRIIGSNPDDLDYGSVILITPDSDECISPEIVGFTIQGGSGTKVLRDGNPVTLGGGILADVSDPHIHHNAFENNGSEEVYSGGAAQLTSSAEDWSFDNRFENYNPRCDVEEFRLTDNLYNGNDAQYGNTMANRFHEDEFDMSGSIFDVFDCGNEENEVSSVWVKVEPEATVDYDDGAGQLCAFTAPDVYVDSNIPEECLDEGCGFSNNPFKTIVRTFEMINATESNPITIHLLAGTYSPETGQSFPIYMDSNINLIGDGREITILDAEQLERVLVVDNSVNAKISNLSIVGGYAVADDSPMSGSSEDSFGGGIYVNASTISLLDLQISGNLAYSKGGGVYITNSYATIGQVKINENISYNNGGGIYINECDEVVMNYVDLRDNLAFGSGGAISHAASSLYINYGIIVDNTAYATSGAISGTGGLLLNHVTMSDNSAYEGGGGMYSWNNNEFEVYNSIFWNNYPNSLLIGGDLENILFHNNNIEMDGPLSSLDFITAEEFNEMGNISLDPLFSDPDNGDYTLTENSPCIDNANNDLWGQDLDESAADMGGHGGLFVIPNFTSYNFNEIGDIPSSIEFLLTNYRETSIIIDSVAFTSSNFVANISFPIIIEPLENKELVIEVNNSILGNFDEEKMLIYSESLPNDLSVDFYGTASEGSILSGNISGFYENQTYRITSDLTIQSNDTVVLEPGTKLHFDGEYGLYVYGVLKAVGSESDSILFEGFEDNYWSGIKLLNNDNDTEIEFARISSVSNENGALYIFNSELDITNIQISDNWMNAAWSSSGINIYESNVMIDYALISENLSPRGGGIHLENSDLILKNSEMIRNLALGSSSASIGGGIYAVNSTFEIENTLLSNNGSEGGGGAIFMSSSSGNIVNSYIIDNHSTGSKGGGLYITSSFLNMNNVILSYNTAGSSGGGLYILNSTANLSRVIIDNNISLYGSGINISSDSNCFINHATIVKNLALDIGGSNQGGGGICENGNSSFFEMKNSIVWGNIPESIYASETNIIINSVVEGDWDGNGENIIDQNPLFMDFDNDDYNLQEDSPCIDTGTADLDGDGIDEVTNFIGLGPDMGAFEYCILNIIDECGIYCGDNSTCAGCTDFEALNYDPEALVEGECLYNNSNALDLFISEYVEGSGQNRAIEIYNPTDYPINLIGVELWIISSGGDWVEGTENNKIYPEYELNPGEVFVFCSSDFSQECNFVEILPFSGDDAIGLVYDGIIIDQLGSEGIDPGSGWMVSGIEDATKNHTLVRHPNIVFGDLDWENSAANGWIVYNQDVIEYLGSHEVNNSSIMEGDTNFDGIVDILDIVRIVNQIMGNSEFNDDEFTAADFNADGIVDILDIVQIVNYILDN